MSAPAKPRKTRIFLAELGFDMCEPVTIWNDNAAANNWATAAQSMRKAKHLAIRYHFVRECTEGGVIQPKPVSSACNTADAFTKPLAIAAFETHRATIGVLGTD